MRKKKDAAGTTQFYRHESNLLKKARSISQKKNLTLEEVQQKYSELVEEYQKLLDKTQKSAIVQELQQGVVTADDKIEQLNVGLDGLRQKTDRVNREKSEFLFRVSHEVRSLLNAILGRLELILLTELDGEQMDYLCKVKETGENVLHIINDLLDYSRLEVSQLAQDIHDFKLESVIRLCTRMMEKVSAEKELTLSYHIDSQVPTFLKGDLVSLKHVIINLLTNAVRFTDKGNITITVERTGSTRGLPTRQQYPEDRITLLFKVSNSGLGIPGEVQETILNNVGWAAGINANRYGTMGLALATSKHLVERMGGSIWADSIKDEGKMFSFVVTFDAGKEQDAITQLELWELARPTEYPLRILMVEDNIMAAQMLSSALTRQGHHITHVVNGKKALEQLRKETFDLVLMDLEMPEMDGYEASSRIRTDKTGDFAPDIPILAVTAHFVPAYWGKIIKSGINDYITKPVDVNEISNLLAGFKPGDKTISVSRIHKVRESAGAIVRSADKGIEQIIDRTGALLKLGGDSELFEKICGIFLQEIPGLRENLHEAAALENHEQTRRVAHYLKGSAAMVGSGVVVRLAGDLETAAHQERGFSELKNIIELVEKELGRLEAALAGKSS